VGLETSSINLLTATLDLQLVKLLRAATADDAALSPTPGARRAVQPESEILPRQRIRPAPIIEPRQRIEPAPRFEPRPVVERAPAAEACSLPPSPDRCRAACYSKTPIEPPWKVLPWENPSQPAPKVKVVICRPDIVSKGSLIDFFI
jgi:hypothetical protein